MSIALQIRVLDKQGVRKKTRRGRQVRAMTTEPQRDELLERLAHRIGELGLTAPAILFLEAYKPLAFLGAQLLWVTQPFLSIMFQPNDLHDLASLMQDDAGTDALIARLESLR
jgi:hypothetical protein